MEQKQIKTNALFSDEQGNVGLLIGHNYVGMGAGYITLDDGRIGQELDLFELEEQYDMTKKNNEKKEGTQVIRLVFLTPESIDALIHNLKFLRSKFFVGPAILDAKLEDQDFSVRTLNVLRCAELVTVRDLVRYKRADLLKFRNFGKVSLQNIDEWLEKHELHFGMDV